MSATETFTVVFATRHIPPVLECAACSEAAMDAVFATKIGLRIRRAKMLIMTKLPLNDHSARRRSARHNTGDVVVLGRNVYGSSRQGLVHSQGVSSPLWAFMNDGKRPPSSMTHCACVLCGQT